MVLLGMMQKPVVMPHYPHMMAEDIEVWSRYLASPVVAIEGVWYDVHVGRGMEVSKNATEVEKRVAAGVGKKRIDAVCRCEGVLWVVEVKPVAGMLALGQAVNYTNLFVREFAPLQPVMAVVVCDRFDEDVVESAEVVGVTIIANLPED